MIHHFASVDEVVDAYRFCIDNPFNNSKDYELRNIRKSDFFLSFNNEKMF